MSQPAHDRAFATNAAPASGATHIEQWAAVEDAARVVAMLAGRQVTRADPIAAERIAQLAQTANDRSEPALFALQELVATMRVGLDALLSAHGTAANPRTAAVRLWSEYERGRAKLLRETDAALAGQGAMPRA
ncbi:MAG: hypothetical protein GW855_10755 [Erythrobacter sp.]|nr:hypothetical protein [Erythrobacter sp.]NCQ63991.1 hypothetical protein [Alphaproteobacteria bacterium]